MLTALLGDALAGLNEGHDALRAKVMVRLAEALIYGGSMTRREELCAEGVAIARRLGDPSVLAYVLGSTHYATYGPANAVARLAMADEQIERPDGRVELAEDVVLDDPALFNEDLAPTKIARRTWRTYTFAALGISMAHCIPTYMLASVLISAGMNWWPA